MKLFNLPLFFIIILIHSSKVVEASDNLYINTKGGVYIHEIKQYNSSSDIFLNNQKLLTVEYKDKYFLIHAIPYESELGQNNLEIKINNNISHLSFNVEEKTFDTQNIHISSKYIKPSINNQKRINLERENLRVAKNNWYDEVPDLKFIIPANGTITGRFGTKRFYNGKEGSFHNGLDVAAERGSPIISPSKGKVILTGNYYYNGKFILLDHGKGLKSIFIHLDEILVKKGQIMSKGDLIGKMGNTGKSAGPHLHWSLLLSKTYVDPEYFLDNQIIDYFSLKVE
ncbi:MAG: murein DD-endopeptidase MepM/ murein hydrolase activator NlpD [Gammaproteobacteria bacterium]|jgi:murein DD-endopeptidase MepM/ murein hydrolase activator NlpD|tara:strand:- start:12 stop:863 length:852 start_codon:yes stop_codon:yes gene_type:complete